jgi:FkbM family methyltransferase
MLRHIKNHINGNGIFIDVGANIGNHTIFFSKICGANKVIAIEAVPENINILEKNVKANNCSNVEIIAHPIGLTSEKRQVVRFNENMGSCFLENNTNPTELVEGKKKVIKGDVLEIKTLEELGLDTLDKVNLIKIDCENMSLEVLRAFIPIIKMYKPAIFIEATDKELKEISGLINYKKLATFNATPTHFLVAN